MASTHIWPTCRNGDSPYIWPTHQNCQHSHLTWEEPNPLAMKEWLSPYIWPTRQNGYRSQHSYLTSKEPNTLTMTECLSPYIWPWKEPTLSPCQNGYGTHHFPLEETSIWRTPSFSLKYLNFTLANGFVNTSAIYSSAGIILGANFSPVGYFSMFFSQKRFAILHFLKPCFAQFW